MRTNPDLGLFDHCGVVLVKSQVVPIPYAELYRFCRVNKIVDSDVFDMMRVGIIECFDTLAGTSLEFADGLSRDDALAAWRVVAKLNALTSDD